jgi:protein-tyrosine phosphatase
VNGQWEDFNALERRRESEDPHKTFSDGQSSQDGPLRTDARRQKEERLQSASVSNGSKILDPKHFPRQDLSPAYADKINEASLDYSNQTSITPESNVNNLTYKTASRETTPVYTDSQISESPGRMEVEALRSLSVPIPRLITPGSSATAPTTPSKANRASRPILARLNTSEAVKKVSGDAKADSTRKLSLSISRLMVNTSFDAPRSNTLSEGILPKAAATLIHPKNMLQDENQYILSKPFPQSEARHLPPTGSGTGKNSFEPSEILPGFLYLGPDISTPAEVEYLKKEWGIKRILNAAYEVEDGGGQHLRLNNAEWSGIERYKKISMRDTVEAKGVQEDIEEACAFIDDAKLHSAPLYVHCKAGKSRSVLLVMAYLIHSNRWTLPQAYSYVVERRQAVSPNIGFVAELMTFEQRRLNPKRSGVTRPKSKGNTGERTQGFSLKKISNRESLPTDMAIYPPTTLSFWDHLNGSQGKAVELNHDSTLHKTSANQERTDDFVVPLGITSLKEYIGHDGRYHARRPPADEKLQAPTWRATMAAVDSDHIFSFANVAAGASE